MKAIHIFKSDAGVTFLLAGVMAVSLSVQAALPEINNSVVGYGKSVDGAVSDKLFYTLGGGSVISQPATRSTMQKLGVNVGWSSDLMCGNFDLKTTVGNQLNGVTSGFKNLMGDVIKGATGAVASMPAMLIQRANPGLYDMLTNGVLQANVAFDKAQLNCQNMAKKMLNFSDSNLWTQQAMAEEYKSVVNSGDGDAIRANDNGNEATGTSGNKWIGGESKGGKNQPAIKITHDLAAAGFNMMNDLPVTSTSSVSPSGCNGRACSHFSNAEEAAKTMVKVLGDTAIRTCGKKTDCTSGDADDQPGVSVAGTGFAPLLEETTKENAEQLMKLVSGTEKPTFANLAKLKTGSLPVTAGVINSLRRDPDRAALTARLAGELAMADTVETALIMRRMLITGMSEPYAAQQTAAMAAGEKRLDVLDREIAALKTEMDLKRELSRNSTLTIIERDNQRVESNPQIQIEDDTDSRFNQLAQPRREK